VTRFDRSKGLAAAAVTSLTVTGLAVALPPPASAAGSGVVLISLFNDGHDASARYDGEEAIGLTAARVDPTVTAIAFEYNANPNATDGSPGWTPIGPGGLVGDFARLLWTPDPTLVGTSVAVRAVASAPGGTTYATRQGVAITKSATDAGPHSIGFSGGFGSVDLSTQGYFTQPYASTGRTATRAAVVAFTSARDGVGQLSWWDPMSQTFQGKVVAEVQPYESKVLGPPPDFTSSYVELGTVTADLDLTPFGADPGDVVAVGAELDTDDVQPRTLYAQTVGTVTAEAPTAPAGTPTTVVVTVRDLQQDRPLAGAEVRRLGDSSLVGYTDADGRVRDIQTSGSLPDYYVNTTDVDAYEPGTDTSATVTTYAPDPAYAVARSRDGRAFDDDEYAAGDLFLDVTDANRLPVPAGKEVSYRVYRSGTAAPATFQTATTDAQGRAPIVFDPNGPDGDYVIDYHVGTDADAHFDFTAGDSTLAVSPAPGKAKPGKQIVFTGTLKVGARPLAGRRVEISYKRGLELVPGRVPDASIAGTGGPTTIVTTDASGSFTFIIADQKEKPQGAETGGRVTLATLAAAGDGSLAGNPGETASAKTAFGSKKGRAKVKLKGSSAGSKDRLVAKGPRSLAGEKVKFYRLVGGKLELIKKKRVGKKGTTRLVVADSNGAGLTTYVVKVVTSKRVKGSTSKKLNLR
jgi:hypothetical protein